MITANEIYWFTRLDGINHFLTASTILLALFVLILCVIYLVNAVIEEQLLKQYHKPIIWSISICLFFAFINVLTPSTKETIAIYAIPKIANNEQVIGIGKKGLGILEAELTEWLEDLKKEE